MVTGGIVEETRQVFMNIRAVLEEYGLDLTDIVNMNVLLANMDDFDAMNKVYEEELVDHKPARAAFAVKELPKGALVEIVATAWKVFK